MSQSVIPVPPVVLDKVVSFVEVSSLLSKQAMDENAVHRKAQEKAAALATPLLDHMIATKVIAPQQKEAAAVMLGAHDTTLQLLKAAVDKIAEKEAELNTMRTKSAGDLGKGVDETETGIAAGGTFSKSGEYNSLTHPIVGAKDARVKESDKHLLRHIGK